MNLILIGPQGSGKGTQAQNLIKQYQLIHLEMGQLVREAAQKHNRKGEIIDHLANQKGQLLPDGVVLDILFNHLETTGFSNLLFDGYPRTVNQYTALKELLTDQNQVIDHALYLKISDEESLNRLSSRRICSQCQKTYSLYLEPDRQQCDCQGQLIQRQDDQPEAIRQRLKAFHHQTEPILQALSRDNLLIEINGQQDIDVIFQEITQKLK